MTKTEYDIAGIITVLYFITRTEFAIDGWKAGTVAKIGGTWTVVPDADISFAPKGIMGKTRKAALAAYVAAYVAARAAHNPPAPVGPIPCGTCGSTGCRSRFDCSPGYPNDWQ